VKYSDIFEAWFLEKNSNSYDAVYEFLEDKCNRKLTEDERSRSAQLCRKFKANMKIAKNKSVFITKYQSNLLQNDFYFDLIDVSFDNAKKSQLNISNACFCFTFFYLFFCVCISVAATTMPVCKFFALCEMCFHR